MAPLWRKVSRASSRVDWGTLLFPGLLNEDAGAGAIYIQISVRCSLQENCRAQSLTSVIRDERFPSGPLRISRTLHCKGWVDSPGLMVLWGAEHGAKPLFKRRKMALYGAMRTHIKGKHVVCVAKIYKSHRTINTVLYEHSLPIGGHDSESVVWALGTTSAGAFVAH